MQPSNDIEAFVHRYFDEFRILTSGTREERLAAEHADRVSDWLVKALRTPRGAEDAWPVIVALVEGAPDDEAVAFVAAGPLEDLIRDHGPRFLDRLEAQARTSVRFRDALSGVWGWEDMPSGTARAPLPAPRLADRVAGTRAAEAGRQTRSRPRAASALVPW